MLGYFIHDIPFFFYILDLDIDLSFTSLKFIQCASLSDTQTQFNSLYTYSSVPIQHVQVCVAFIIYIHSSLSSDKFLTCISRAKVHI